MNGLDLVRRTYTRLKKPSQAALPWQQLLETVGEVVAKKKLDLALSGLNSTGTVSDWFTPSATDFALADVGISGVMIPTRLERRGVGSDWEVGEDVPAINYDVFDTSIVHSVAFYGEPLRIAFRDALDYVTEQEYRVVYEPDVEGDLNLGSDIGLPLFFKGMVALESAFILLEQVEDPSPEWKEFFAMADKRWPVQIADDRRNWETFVRKFKGRAQTPKRTYFQNERGPIRTRYFKG